MDAAFTGIVVEMERRLREALAPARLEIVNDSARHHGHSGDDGSGESHFSLIIEAEAFAGLSRVARQRAVFAALGDLVPRIHALAIRARAPGEPPAGGLLAGSRGTGDTGPAPGEML